MQMQWFKNTLVNLLIGWRYRLLQVAFAIFAMVLLTAAYMWATYSIPMLKGKYESAARSMLGEKEFALYDAGLEAYSDHDYQRAIKLLGQAFTETANSDGEIPKSRENHASEIKFLIGLSQQKSKQPKQAIESYKEALRLNPNHSYAKYNLEMLLQPDPNGSSNQQPDGQKPSSSPKGKI
jgi:tetratricopeptide (TPR) repeat protein